MEIRSNDGSGASRLASARNRTAGGQGSGVGTRTRATSIRPAPSRTDALRPVPPMSIDKVRAPLCSMAAYSPFADLLAAFIVRLSPRRCPPIDALRRPRHLGHRLSHTRIVRKTKHSGRAKELARAQ